MSMSFKVLVNKFFYRLVYYVAKRVTKKKYSFKTDRVPNVGEPYIMISNHTTEEDMLFAGLASKRHMYYVCGEHLLRNKTYGKLLRVLINPIPLPKGGASLEAVKEMIKRVKQGYNVCFFPEGKRSFLLTTSSSGCVGWSPSSTSTWRSGVRSSSSPMRTLCFTG